jgi:hypothetical protein
MGVFNKTHLNGGFLWGKLPPAVVGPVAEERIGTAKSAENDQGGNFYFFDSVSTTE